VLLVCFSFWGWIL